MYRKKEVLVCQKKFKPSLGLDLIESQSSYQFKLREKNSILLIKFEDPSPIQFQPNPPYHTPHPRLSQMIVMQVGLPYIDSYLSERIIIEVVIICCCWIPSLNCHSKVYFRPC